MRNRRLMLLIVVAVALTCVTANLAGTVDNTADVLKSEAKQALVKADFAAGDTLLSNDYVGVRAPDGQVLAANRGASMLYKSIDPSGLQAHVFGTTGVVSGLLRVDGSENGKPVAAEYRYSRVYANRDGRWQPVFTQFTRVHR